DDGPPGHQVTSGKPCAPAAARRTSGNGGPLGGGGCSPRGGWAARRGGRRSGRSSLTLTAAGCVTPGPVVIRQGDEALAGPGARREPYPLRRGAELGERPLEPAEVHRAGGLRVGLRQLPEGAVVELDGGAVRRHRRLEPGPVEQRHDRVHGDRAAGRQVPGKGPGGVPAAGVDRGAGPVSVVL